MDEMDRSRGTDLLLLFLIGGVAGAATALLLAPQSGAETRQKIREGLKQTADRGRELQTKLADKGRALAGEASSLIDRQREELKWQKERLAAAVEAGREAYTREKV